MGKETLLRMYYQDMYKAAAFLFLLILPLMVNSQSDVNIKNVLDKKSTIITKRTWGSWNCNNRQSGDQSNYDLFCKFLEFPTDQDTNDKILPDLLDCVDIGVKYKEKKNKHRLGKINQIASAELCRQKCSDTD